MKKIIFVLSDSTGETAMTLLRAALVHYKDPNLNIKRYKNIRNEVQLERIIEEALNADSFLVHTITSHKIRGALTSLAKKNKIREIDLLGPVLSKLDTYFGISTSEAEPGLLRSVDEKYYKRIEAIEFTVKHDDGRSHKDLKEADIILVGISRTSKTPLSVFLSHNGWKVANVPLVYGTEIPEQLFEVDQKKIIGLTIDPPTLYKIRKNRLQRFGSDKKGDYAQIDKIEQEIAYAQDLFKKNRSWPVFNVTDKALEETASEIIKIISTRMGLKTPPLF